MARLARSHIMICGVGAVGGMAAEMMARVGAGRITLLDFDTVNESNINRQIVALHSTIGKKKIDVMAARILDINPACIVKTIDEKITEQNVGELLARYKPDLVLDAIDDVRAKVSLLESCIRGGIPVASSMGAAQRRDLSKIKTGTIGQTKGCPLARAVRTGLRARNVDISKTLCVYSDEEIGRDVASARNMAGALPSFAPMTSTIGIRLADLAIKLLSA